MRCFLPSRSTLVRREGRECLWLLSVACGLAPSSPPPSGGGGAGVGSLAADALFPASPSLLTLPNSHRTFHDVRIRGILQSLAPAFYPPASRALQERGSRVDKRARSREVSSRGRRCRSRSSYRSRLSGRERGGAVIVRVTLFSWSLTL